MILQLSQHYGRRIAALYATLFYLSWVLPIVGRGETPSVRRYSPTAPASDRRSSTIDHRDKLKGVSTPAAPKRVRIGGPSQPEMSSFKSVGTNNMVNLFTGDFNYNIPLMDVGGYPVNIYYDGGIGPEQEASWVGLGWNVNPGNINRNVRGVPDDFNGTDTLQQLQVMKPNKTWGLGIGADLELLGIKAPINASLGVAFNNYLGPSLDLALRGTAGYKIGGIAGSEKTSASAGLNLGIDINSRSGTSFSGSVSLTANAKMKENSAGFGVGLSTGYNSRSGIKALQISEQTTFNLNLAKNGVANYYANNFLSNASKYSTSITFVKPSYLPSIRMPLTNTAWSGHFQLGLGSWGVAADVEAEVYGQKSEVAPADTLQKKPMVGYLYYQNAVGNPGYVMDLARYNDREVTPNTPVISAPQYSYDVFSIQGEGTGGSIRAYRNDLGYVRDNITTSKDKNLSLGVDIDPPAHYGGNFNTVRTPSTIGEWNTGNKLRSVIPFTTASKTFENVYFRNPGENAVIDSNRYAQIGGTDLVRFVLGGSGNSPTIEPKLQSYNSLLAANTTLIDLTKQPINQLRNKRTQVINFLTAAEAGKAGLDTMIKSYDNTVFLDNVADTLIYQPFPRVDGMIRKAHHISQINVTENNGRRYVYGIPVYNLLQKDLTFSVNNAYSQVPDKILVNDSTQMTANSPLVTGSFNTDGYVQVTTTPPYAHSFLLTGILSPDYVDVTGNGISEDDLGEAVKFNYTRIQSGSRQGHIWRAPLSMNDSANFNAGLRSETKDDKAIISYGARESWYLQSIESKAMIALFYVSNRLDGKGAVGPTGKIDTSDHFIKKLDSIALYNKADLRTNGLAKAKPVKTVHFVYSYLLCQNTPDNTSTTTGSQGKLTLQNIYFTYNGKTRAFKNNYSFTYNSTGTDNPADNPAYSPSSADRWGSYKPPAMNPGSLKNSDYPYVIQDAAQKTAIDQNVSAWMLKKIVLPSGGQMEVSYEADDYGYVQNKRATEMMKVAGFGSTTSYSAASDRLYPFQYPSAIENDYVFVQVPIACANATEVYNRYLQGISQLAFKLWVVMPKGPEYITCYANFSNGNYGVDANNSSIIWVKMDRLAGKSPVSLTALEYLRQQLPGQAFTGYDISGEPGLKQVGDMLVGMLQSLRDAFTDPVNAFRKDGKAMHTDLTKCFVRLNDPDGFKYGGGHRVRSVILRDNWNAMTGQYTSSYGQKYDYTTTESFNGTVRRISSGVASYEPSIGSEENPFQSIIQVQDNLPAGPSSFGAVEMPVLDAFFPSPVVGYSKVTVTSIKMDTSSAKKSRSGIGKQVTEFYTAKDYPVSYSYTPFDAGSIKEFHQASTLAFFNKYAYDYKAQSQGFLVATNDMHGKMRSQSSYAESDTATRISYTENFYRNTGVNGLNDKFSFINKDSSGTVYPGNMGIDVDLMTDAREFSVKSSSREIQGQVDIFYFIIPIPIPTIWPVNGNSENIYRSVTTTKVVNYHSVLDSMVVMDKGSVVTTKNLAYDAQTGEVLVSRTNNEFNQPVYNTSYPAYWAYGGMGSAYKNINATYSGITFSDGKLTTPGFDLSVFESGDELLIMGASPGSGCDAQFASNATIIWALDKNKNTTSLVTTPDLIFIDQKGNPYSMASVSFRIIRSGHRNMLDAKVATITGMDNPIASGKLLFNSSSRVTNASAIEYKEKWQVDNDVFGRFRLVKNPTTCIVSEVPDSLGYLEKAINPYRKGLAGNFKSYRNMVFYDTRKEYDTTASTNISANGFLNNFKLYWDFNTSNNLVPDTLSTQWVWNTKLNKTNAKGLELETQDALGIFTAAQYGYNKTMPVAIANNSRYNEMFAEGFEDYGYGESIDNTSYNFFNRHINFRNIPGSSLVLTDTANFKAHSGKYVLGVNANATASLSIPIVGQPDNSPVPTFTFPKDTTMVLNTLGGNYSFTTAIPASVPPIYQGGATYYTTQPGIQVQIYTADSAYGGGATSNKIHSYSFNGNFYINITTPGTYSFSYTEIASYDLDGPMRYFTNEWDISITDTFGNTISSVRYPTSSTSISGSYNVFLCPGIYNISFAGNEYFDGPNIGAAGNSFYSWWCTNSSSPDYQTLSKTYGCFFTRAVPASTTMINPVFNVPAYKKMVFSGWVHETCGNPSSGISCKVNAFTHDQVQLKFAGSSTINTFNPTGPIIDGWQRYEGAFMVPTGATSMTLNLVNSGTNPVYFDDIRIQPFNANLKSYIYDPVNLRLVAELDANNYAAFYEYDEEGTLVRTKAETREGIKTVTESRSALQKAIQ
ncbi:MAG: hypothetical protein J0H74_23635 [Chitinophagaceae bacterium]|nr:hypothetical protein [Chitinophagaceae bacterium]